MWIKKKVKMLIFARLALSLTDGMRYSKRNNSVKRYFEERERGDVRVAPVASVVLPNRFVSFDCTIHDSWERARQYLMCRKVGMFRIA